MLNPYSIHHKRDGHPGPVPSNTSAAGIVLVLPDPKPSGRTAKAPAITPGLLVERSFVSIALVEEALPPQQLSAVFSQVQSSVLFGSRPPNNRHTSDYVLQITYLWYILTVGRSKGGAVG